MNVIKHLIGMSCCKECFVYFKGTDRPHGRDLCVAHRFAVVAHEDRIEAAQRWAVHNLDKIEEMMKVQEEERKRTYIEWYEKQKQCGLSNAAAMSNAHANACYSPYATPKTP